jgi:chromosome segregation ATPase
MDQYRIRCGGIKMNEQATIEKINLLSEFEAQRDLLEMDKQRLLAEVKVPEEVQAIVSEGMKNLASLEQSYSPSFLAVHAEVEARLAEIAIPPEIQSALAEIDRKRAEVMDYQAQEIAEINSEIRRQKETIQAAIESQTADVYKAVAQRKADIEAEFRGKREAVNENIAKLETEIKAEVKEIGFTVKGNYYKFIYEKPRKSWIPQRLEKYVEGHPDIKSCYTVGEPVIAKVKI